MNNEVIDRGIIKWQPFNSCFNSEEVIKDLKIKKERKIFPTLSEDQINLISEEILTAYNLKLNIMIEYYYDGNIKKITGKLNYLNKQDKKLLINNTYLYFKQILKIMEI